MWLYRKVKTGINTPAFHKETVYLSVQIQITLQNLSEIKDTTLYLGLSYETNLQSKHLKGQL